MAIHSNLKGGSSKKLYEALQYSGLVTEDMTFAEMCEVLAKEYPDVFILYQDGVNGGEFEGFACSLTSDYASYAVAPTITFGANMKVATVSGSTYRRGAAISKAINLSSFKTIELTHSSRMIYTGNEASDNWRVDVFITPIKSTVVDATISKNLFKGNGSTVSNTGKVSIDVSSLKGEYYIGIYVQAFGSYNTETEITDMYLK